MTDWIAATATLLVPVLGRALLAFVWQGALVGALAALALRLLRDARPQARYAVACLALLACALLPLVGIALQLFALAQSATPMAAPELHLREATGAQAAAIVGAWPRGFDDLLPTLVATWAAGAGALSLRMAFGLAWIQRLRAAPQGAAQAAWQARLDALSQRFAPMRRVALRLVDGLDSPVSAGCWRPVVLLPAALAARMPVELVEALLAHELAHVRRHDYLVNLLQCVVEALLFYHPVTWWLSRRIRIEREQVADALAAEAIGSPHRLAVALSGLAGMQPLPAPPSRFAPAAHGGQLMSRIQQLVRPGRRVAGGRIALTLVAIAATGIALYAHAAQVQRPAEAANPVAAAAPAPRPAAAALPAPLPGAASGPVLAAAAPAETPKGAAAHTRISLGDDDGEAFALLRKGVSGYTMSGSSDDFDDIAAARTRMDRDFIWFRRDGAAYVIDDPVVVAKAHEAWRDSEGLDKQMEALDAQMDVHEDRMDQLGDQMEKLSETHRETPRMREASAAMERLAAQQRTLAAEQGRLGAAMATADDAGQDALDRQMEAIDQQMDALSRQMEAQEATLEAASAAMEKQTAPMEALGRQMEEASKPMEALGKQLEALGERQDAQARRAEATTRSLIADAMQRGLARPAPQK
ncbi:MAG TPA: M56 family metallopeptidase [Luteimonas sp.]|nr:M56 family metallopeptidase [Luteimonas sp.]